MNECARVCSCVCEREREANPIPTAPGAEWDRLPQEYSLQGRGWGPTIQTPAHPEGASPDRPSPSPSSLTPSQRFTGPHGGPQGLCESSRCPSKPIACGLSVLPFPGATVTASEELFLEKLWGSALLDLRGGCSLTVCKLGVTALPCSLEAPAR